MKAFLTGAAGFIGSHLADSLIDKGWEVVGVDNLSTGRRINLEVALESPNFEFERLDLREPLPNGILDSVDVVFHLAADPEVRTGLDNPQSQFENNILCTYNILESSRKSRLKRLYYMSSSTVYGEPTIIPTPEAYSPLIPISIYGCAKLASETMILGYAETFGLKAVILRPANVVGPRATHGVLLDFVRKLMRNPSTLEILGNGKQDKSYVDVTDVCSAILMLEKVAGQLGSFELFNVGNTDTTSVLRIADIVCHQMGLTPAYRVNGGIDGGRAWKGDVRKVLLSINRLSALGWHPRFTSDETVLKAAILNEDARWLGHE